VGPSGAGKTTLLKAIAGLLRPQRGRVIFAGRTWFDDATWVPPEHRPIGFVFQGYALFPHLSVSRNIAFGARGDISGLLRRFSLEHVAEALPARLSGGERQRVALARALARRPELLLLDEPLSALDPALRAELRAELNTSGLPAIVVTHDFDDAVALAERVAVMVAGRIVQIGTPAEVVAAPCDPFVARLAGINLLTGLATPAADGLTEVVLDGGGSVYSTDRLSGRVGILVHPWEVTLAPAVEGLSGSALNRVVGEIASVVVVGNRARVRVGELTAEVTAASAERMALARGRRVSAAFKATATRLIPLEPPRG
jgi:molybdate transport system ATP-binding protein